MAFILYPAISGLSREGDEKRTTKREKETGRAGKRLEGRRRGSAVITNLVITVIRGEARIISWFSVQRVWITGTSSLRAARVACAPRMSAFRHGAMIIQRTDGPSCAGLCTGAAPRYPTDVDVTRLLPRTSSPFMFRRCNTRFALLLPKSTRFPERILRERAARLFMFDRYRTR